MVLTRYQSRHDTRMDRTLGDDVAKVQRRVEVDIVTCTQCFKDLLTSTQKEYVFSGGILPEMMARGRFGDCIDLLRYSILQAHVHNLEQLRRLPGFREDS